MEKKENKKNIIISKFYLINNKGEEKNKKWFFKKAKEKKGKYFTTRKEGIDYFKSLNLDARLWISKEGKFYKTVLSEKKEVLVKKTKKDNLNNTGLFYPRKNIYNALFNKTNIETISREEEEGLYQEEMNLAIQTLVDLHIPDENKNEKKEPDYFIPVVEEVKPPIIEEVITKKEQIKEYKEFIPKNIYIPWVVNPENYTRDDEEFMIRVETKEAIKKLIDKKTFDKKESNENIPLITFFKKEEEKELHDEQVDFLIKEEPKSNLFLEKKENFVKEKNKLTVIEKENFLKTSSITMMPDYEKNSSIIYDNYSEFKIEDFSTEKNSNEIIGKKIDLENEYFSNPILETSKNKAEDSVIISIDQTSTTNLEDVYQANYISLDDSDSIEDTFLNETEFFENEKILNGKEEILKRKDIEKYTSENNYNLANEQENDEIITAKDIEHFEEYNNFETENTQIVEKEIINEKENKKPKKNKRKWYKLWLGR